MLALNVVRLGKAFRALRFKQCACASRSLGRKSSTDAVMLKHRSQAADVVQRGDHARGI